MGVADSTLDELLARLAAPAPSPCGGATAALTAAMASSLVAMVAAGSPGWEEGLAVETRARELRGRLVELAERDTEAVAGLVALRRLGPAERAGAIERAAREAASLAALAEASGKRGMRADATAARLLADAAARVADEIVAVNSGG